MPRSVKPKDKEKYRDYFSAYRTGILKIPLTEDMVKGALKHRIKQNVSPESRKATSTIIKIEDEGIRIRIPSRTPLIKYREILDADKIMRSCLPDSMPDASRNGDYRASGIDHTYYAPALAELVWRELCDVSSDTLRAEDLEVPERVEMTVSRIVRDSMISKHIKTLHNYKCQICGETIVLADGSHYAEGHHLKPLGRSHNGPDKIENMLCLCPNHHAACDLGAIRINQETLRSVTGHTVGSDFIDYHNTVIFKG